MHKNFLIATLAFGCFVLLGTSAQGGEPVPWSWEPELLRDRKIGTDPDSLIKFLAKRSNSDDDLLNIDKLVEQLASNDFQKREEAQKKLRDLGSAALDLLSKAAQSKDAEAARRARDCVEQNQKENNTDVSLAAVRMLVQAKPAGALEALLRFLPYSIDEDLDETIYYGLDALGVNEGKVDPALVAALEDKVSARRAVAGCIVGRSGNYEQKKQVRNLLNDKDPHVRLRSAQGLLAGREKAAVPALLELLDHPRLDIAWQAEELLRYAAGKDAPAVTIWTKKDGRKARPEWKTWWNGARASFVFRRTQYNPAPRLALVAEESPENSKRQRVCLLGADGNIVRWEVGEFDGVRQVVLLGDAECLVVDLKKMSLRGLDGVELKRVEAPPRVLPEFHGLPQKYEDMFQEAQYLAGQRAIFVVTGPLNLAVIGYRVDARLTGELVPIEVPRRKYPAGDTVWRHLILGNGNMALVREKSISELDLQSWREQKAVAYPNPSSWSFVSRRGTIFVQGEKSAELLELDGEGRCIRRTTNEEVSEALRVIDELPDGGILALSDRHQLAELNAKGEVVWELLRLKKIDFARRCFPLVAFGFKNEPEQGPLSSAKYRLAALESECDATRMFAAWKISKYPKEAATSVRRLLRIYLSDDLGAAREYARNSIATVGKPALNQVLARLNGEEPQAVVAVLNLLTSMHVDDAEGAKAIVAKLSDPNEAVAKAAAQALFCSTKTEFCVPLFSELLESGKANHAVRSTVVWSLATLGKDGAAATPGLIRAMSDKDPEIRRMSLGALEKIGCRNAPFVQALARAIFDDDKILRDDAFKDLAALGAPERSGEEVLIEALRNTEIKDEKERNQFVRDVIRAFDRFRGNKSAVVVATFLANTKLEVGTRQVAAEMVGKPGIRTKDILPQLRKSLEGVRGELERDPENNALRQLERTIQQAIADID